MSLLKIVSYASAIGMMLFLLAILMLSLFFSLSIVEEKRNFRINASVQDMNLIIFDNKNKFREF